MSDSARTLTAPGELHTARIGRVTVTAQLAVGGGVTITIWPTASAYDAIRLPYVDGRHARRAYAVIAQLARTGASAEDIAAAVGAEPEAALAAVKEILDDALRVATADDSTASAGAVRALQDAVAEVETDAERAANDKLAAEINAHLDAVHRPAKRSFADLKAEFSATHPNVTPLTEVRRQRRRKTAVTR